MKVDSGELKAVLIPVVEILRQQSKQFPQPVAQARINAKWELIDMLLIWLNKQEEGQEVMKKLQGELIKQVISLEDLEPIKKGSELEEKIRLAVAVLDPGQAGLLEADQMSWGHFSTKVSRMRNDGIIGRDITCKKRGPNFYLVRLPKGQAVKARRPVEA